jgi:hypothetical protein
LLEGTLTSLGQRRQRATGWGPRAGRQVRRSLGRHFEVEVVVVVVVVVLMMLMTRESSCV